MGLMHLLVTLDQNYLPGLFALLQSAFVNNPQETIHVHMIHDNISEDRIEELAAYCDFNGGKLMAYHAPDALFENAPVFSYFAKAMYYRLMAFGVLPDTLDRVLYMDPDMLVINPLRELYETDFKGNLYGACMLGGITAKVKVPLNRMRLGYDAQGYYNSGMLLMNLDAQRKACNPEQIFQYINEHKRMLILPDQDVLNGLYGERILPLDDLRYNYDVSRYGSYRIIRETDTGMDWMMENTVILHYCGKIKPWSKDYRGRFGLLFKHYAAMANRALREIEGTRKLELVR